MSFRRVKRKFFQLASKTRLKTNRRGANRSARMNVGKKNKTDGIVQTTTHNSVVAVTHILTCIVYRCYHCCLSRCLVNRLRIQMNFRNLVNILGYRHYIIIIIIVIVTIVLHKVQNTIHCVYLFFYFLYFVFPSTKAIFF